MKKMKALRYAVLAGLVVSGSVGAEENIYSIHNVWKEQGLTGKAVNNIQHDNLIKEAKEPKWNLIRKSEDPAGYYRLCIPSFNSICLYSTYSNNDIDIKMGYLIGRQKETYLWSFEKLPFRFNPNEDIYKIVNLEGRKVHWEDNYKIYDAYGNFLREVTGNNKPRAIAENNKNMWWWSTFFTKQKITPPTVELPPEDLLNRKDDKIRSDATRTYVLNIEEDGTLTVDLTGLEGDLDLYVQINTKTLTSDIKANNQARTESEDGYCAPFADDTLDERCTLRNLEEGDRVFVRVYSPDPYTAGKIYEYFDIKATLNVGSDNSSGYGSPVSDGSWNLTQAYNGLTHICHSTSFYMSQTNVVPVCDQYALDFAPDDGLNERTNSNAERYDSYKAISIAEGKVVSIVYSDTYQGNSVLIQHSGTPNKEGVYSRYSHLQDGSIQVSVGQDVLKGQNIGIIGNTGYRISYGNSDGRHLHFVLYNVVKEGSEYRSEGLKPEGVGGLTGFPSGYYEGDPLIVSKGGRLSCTTTSTNNCLNIK